MCVCVCVCVLCARACVHFLSSHKRTYARTHMHARVSTQSPFFTDSPMHLCYLLKAATSACEQVAVAHLHQQHAHDMVHILVCYGHGTYGQTDISIQRERTPPKESHLRPCIVAGSAAPPAFLDHGLSRERKPCTHTSKKKNSGGTVKSATRMIRGYPPTLYFDFNKKPQSRASIRSPQPRTPHPLPNKRQEGYKGERTTP